jgi:hypothetical protein
MFLNQLDLDRRDEALSHFQLLEFLIEVARVVLILHYRDVGWGHFLFLKLGDVSKGFEPRMA